MREMIDTEQEGGWGCYERFSPAVRARLVADDRAVAAARRAEDQRRTALAEHNDQVRLRAAVEQAELRGEYVSPAEVARTGGACVGRTRSEFVAYVSAVQDAEDAREQARQRQVQYDPQQHHELLVAANPGVVGRTRAEAVAYYSALGDLQEMEAARRQVLGLPSVEAEVAERREETEFASRALDRRIRTVARGHARNMINTERERQFLAGEISEEQLAG